MICESTIFQGADGGSWTVLKLNGKCSLESKLEKKGTVKVMWVDGEGGRDEICVMVWGRFRK